ncbi:MAG TPA: hypothetical protein VF475_17185 [Sphingobium sp.]
MLLAVPAGAAKRDKPRGDHPERNCKPEKRQCGPTANVDENDDSYWDSDDDYDNPDGDRPDPKCIKRRASCPVGS